MAVKNSVRFVLAKVIEHSIILVPKAVNIVVQKNNMN